MLTQADIQQIQSKGISADQIIAQLNRFKAGTTPSNLVAPATIEKGILQTNPKTEQYYINLYDDYAPYREIVKFVPASGAASRMFKELFACLDALHVPETNADIVVSKFPGVKMVIDHLSEFAFFDALQDILHQHNTNAQQLIENKDYKSLLKYILLPEGLNYGNMPKALLDFHHYKDEIRKAIDEHLTEGALYAKNDNSTVNIHFTISPEHEKWVTLHLDKILPLYEKRHKVKYNIRWSFQHPSTDTVAVDLENNPFRNTDGNLVFRPAGHGALIQNLNEINGDLIFIKNIDNITTDNLRAATTRFKKILAGILIEKEITVKGNISLLIEGDCSDEDIQEIAGFVLNDMNVSLPPDFADMPVEKKKKVLLNKINRPIRVCGMVKNEGEPGGGPFFVENAKGITSLQIVESAQIDLKNSEQLKIFNASTHFNPVDIVAATTDFLGRKFDLNDFVDHDTYMISEKSSDGKALKALELPGLWNGAMAGWITWFVEVPSETFSPVKEINDLLRPQHKN